MLCKKCNTDNTPDSEYCRHCGQALYTKKRTADPVRILLIIFLCICIAVAVISVIILARNFVQTPGDNAAETVSSAASEAEQLPPVAPQEAPTQEAPAPAPKAAGDVEEKVKLIRNWYYQTNNNLGAYNKSTYSDMTVYTDANSNYVRIDTALTDSNQQKWNEQLYFHNGSLYFAFLFRGKTEHRFYFDNDLMFRWINPQKITLDNAFKNSEYMYWQEQILYSRNRVIASYADRP